MSTENDKEWKMHKRRLIPRSTKETFVHNLKKGKAPTVKVGPGIRLTIDNNYIVTTNEFVPDYEPMVENPTHISDYWSDGSEYEDEDEDEC